MVLFIVKWLITLVTSYFLLQKAFKLEEKCEAIAKHDKSRWYHTRYGLLPQGVERRKKYASIIIFIPLINIAIALMYLGFLIVNTIDTKRLF